jgi:phosphonate transport system substrate-binding protein
MGCLIATSGKDDWQTRQVFSSAIKRRRTRGNAGWPAPYRGIWHGLGAYRRKLCRLYPLCGHGGINTPADLRGRTLAFTSPTSNSGFKAPSILLRKKFGLEAGRDYTSEFSGRHENSILGVANKDYDAAAIANEVMRRMIARGVVKEDHLKTIYASETFPTAAFGLAYNLNPALSTKVRDAFFSFSWAGTALEQEFSTLGVSRFVPITYKQAWALVREVDAAMNVQYTCK